MSQIQKYSTKQQGYHPFLISKGWQVAQLNYMEEQEINNISKIDVHRQTDEAFWLQKGKVVLITVELESNKTTFHAELMQHGIVYNIPKNVWHNIAMTLESEVIIVEKSDTHLDDVDFFDLSEKQCIKMREIVYGAFNKPNLTDR